MRRVRGVKLSGIETTVIGVGMESVGGEGIEAGKTTEGVRYLVKSVRKPGVTQRESRIVWSGTVFQIQPNYEEVSEFLSYIQRCWTAKYKFETFKNYQELPDEFDRLAYRFHGIEKGKEPVELLVPLIEWCNRELHEIVWRRFQTARRQAKYDRKSRRYKQVRIDVTNDAHKKLTEFAGQLGVSPSDFILALELDGDGKLTINKWRIGEAKARIAREEFEAEKEHGRVLAVREEVKRAKREATKSASEVVSDKQASGNDAEGASANLEGKAG